MRNELQLASDDLWNETRSLKGKILQAKSDIQINT